MKKRIIIGVLLVALLAGSVACAGAGEESGVTSMPGVTSLPAEEGKGGDEVYGLDDSTATDEERMIVRTGEMSLVVADMAQASDDIARLAVSYGGYVVSSQIWGEEEDMRGWLSFRVPDEKFDQAMAELREMAVKVESESTSSQDVTQEYIDLTARLKNAEATEAQYLALLTQAEDVEDILSIYSYLSQIRQQIEQLKGQIQYLERTTSMSYISVSLEPEEAVVGDGWRAMEVLKSAARGLVTAGKVLGTIIIWLLIFIPIWGTVLGIILWRHYKKKRKA